MESKLDVSVVRKVWQAPVVTVFDAKSEILGGGAAALVKDTSGTKVSATS